MRGQPKHMTPLSKGALIHVNEARSASGGIFPGRIERAASAVLAPSRDALARLAVRVAARQTRGMRMKIPPRDCVASAPFDKGVNTRSLAASASPEIGEEPATRGLRSLQRNAHAY